MTRDEITSACTTLTRSESGRDFLGAVREVQLPYALLVPEEIWAANLLLSAVVSSPVILREVLVAEQLMRHKESRFENPESRE